MDLSTNHTTGPQRPATTDSEPTARPRAASGVGRTVLQVLPALSGYRGLERDAVEIAAALVAKRGQLEPILTTATIFYTDIANFTRIAEGMAPARLVQMLNEYFSAVIQPISRYGGVVNQFQGDAMLVTFNVPLDDPEHADHAVAAAMEMLDVVAGRTFADVELQVRVGINTGEVIAGPVGSGDRVSYTVYGDAVNSAARLEQLCKEFGVPALVSEATVERLKQSYPLKAIGEVPIRGKARALNVYKLAT